LICLACALIDLMIEIDYLLISYTKISLKKGNM